MPFSQLYDHVQTLSPKIKRNELRDKVLALTGVNRVTTVRTTLDITRCRGLFLDARNTERRFVQQCGSTVIVLARGMNVCWERFVYVKELMHIFDGVSEATDSGNDFEAQLAGLTGSAPTPHVLSEIACFWRALSVLCPEHLRLQYEADRGVKISDYEIALTLRIPENYVSRLFEPRYRQNVDQLLAV